MPVTRRNLIKSALLVLPGLVLADAFWFESNFVELNEFYIGSATKDTENIKVVQISDLHLHMINRPLIQLADEINKLQPDLILITGDAFDNAKDITLLNDFLLLIDKSIKKTAILGNWEYFSKVDFTELAKVYNEHNCMLLINQSIQYSLRNRTISITGVDDFLRGNPDIETAMKEYVSSDHHIILVHCPEYCDYISERLNKDAKVDFILSGHTHGGQVNIFGFVPVLPKGCGRYVKGWYNENTPKLYVSKGIGTNIFSPFRLGARAEIALFHLAT
ncbi:MAG: metallophosphoesterase [Bacteroidales bacterium]|nr:metallophosphoesterase [Bacteroidales bacterium]